MKDVVIKFEHVTKKYKLFKSEKRRLLHVFCKKINYTEKKAVDINFFCNLLLPRCSTKNRNNPCSNCKVRIIISNVTYVFIRSTVPYSLVDNMEVYKGSIKKLIHFVQIFPIAIIAVFFNKRDSLDISYCSLKAGSY